VPRLAELLKSGDEADRKAAGDALLWMSGEDANAAVARALDDTTGEAREVLLGILGARGATAHLGKVLGLARDGGTAGVRAAALEAVGVLGSFKDLPLTVEAILAAAGDGERSSARRSFTSICGREKNRDPCTRMLLKAIPGSSVSARSEILAALPDLGDAAALTAARKELKHESTKVQEAAVRALAGWPDDAPADELLAIAKDSPEERHRILALRGYVRMARMSGKRSQEETVKMYGLAFGAARRTEDRKLVLSGLGEVGHVSALEMAEKHLEVGAIKNEAAAAIVKIVVGMRGTDPESAIAAVKRVLDTVDAAAVRKKARAALEYFEEYGDYVTAWLVSGAYSREGLDMEKLIETEFAPEKKGAKDKGWWWPEQDSDSEEPWIVDLNEALWWAENCVGYLKTQVWSPAEQKAVLELGSDDGVKVWLNGVMIHENNAWRGVEPGDDKVDVALKKGWNSMMLKVSQGGGDWGVCARFRSADGKRLSGMRVKPE
jgi:HEAT repeat protein